MGAVIGLLVGSLIGWYAREEVVRELKIRCAYLTKQEQVATDRLVHAWHEKATIQPRPTDEPLPAPDPLPETLQDEVDQYEDPEARATIEAFIRSGLQKGKDPVRILLELDNIHP